MQQTNSIYTHDKSYSYQLGEYLFEQVTSEEQLNTFESFWYNNLYEALGLEPTSKHYGEIVRKSKELDHKLNNQLARVIVYDPCGEPIGTMGVYLDKNELLPAEIKENIDFSGLRKHCRILEVGRMAIDKKFRHKAMLSFGLNMFILLVAMKNQVDLIIESAFIDKFDMFKRIGFKKFKYGNATDFIYHIPKILCYYHFSAKMDAFYSPKNIYNNYQLSNYTNRIFKYIGDEKLYSAYIKMIRRNASLSEKNRSYNMDYENIELITTKV